MSKTTRLLVYLLLMGSVGRAQGPNEGFIMESEARRHLRTHVDPVYPAIAKAAHVQGSVVLHVNVSAAGKVTKIEVIGGPAMLRTAALEAVKEWTYSPFEKDGKPADVQLVVTVPFSLGIPDATVKSDQAIGQTYFPLADQCRSALTKGDWTGGVKICGDAAGVAVRFPEPSQRWNELRLAHQEYGEALVFSGDAKDGLVQFRLATEIAGKSLTETDAEYAGAYYWQAFAEHALRMQDDAERDYETSERSYRKAMISLPDMKNIYGRELAHTLAYHSVLLQQVGRSDEAAKKQAEAVTLDSHALDAIRGAK